MYSRFHAKPTANNNLSVLEAYILVYQFSHIVCMRTQSNRNAILKYMRTLFISFRDSNLPQTLPEDPPAHDLTLNTTKYLGSKRSTQTVRSFDGKIFYKKRFAIMSVEVVIKVSILSLSEFQRGRNCYSHENVHNQNGEGTGPLETSLAPPRSSLRS